MRHLVPRWLPLLAALGWAVPSLGAGSSPVERVVVVGGGTDYPPYEFIDRDGDPAGYNVDLTRAIAEVMGLRIANQKAGQ